MLRAFHGEDSRQGTQGTGAAERATAPDDAGAPRAGRANERRHEREEKGKGFFRSERSYGSFFRQIRLPDGIDPETAKATFKNGVLEVTVPAPPKPLRGRSIPIEEG